MSNLWSFNDDGSGLTYALSDEILADYEELFTQVFPEINTDASTAIGQIISALAEDDLDLIDKMRQMSDYFFNGGSGLMLDMWAYNNFRVIRKSAIPSTVVMTIYGVQDTTIPQGFTVSDGTYQYYIETETQIPVGGKLTALFIANEVYDSASNANTITQIITEIDGVDKVNNENPSTIGSEKETDSQLYLRCIELGSTYANSSLRSILANIAQLDSVIKVSGYENKTDSAITQLNYTIPAHHFVAIVLGGDDEAIGQCISEVKPVGAGTTGNTEVKIMIGSREHSYYFERPSYVALKVSVNCKLAVTSSQNYAELVKEAVMSFVDSLEIGDYITQPAISKAIAEVAYDFDITDVKIGKESEETVLFNKLDTTQIVYKQVYTIPNLTDDQKVYYWNPSTTTDDNGGVLVEEDNIPEGFVLYDIVKGEVVATQTNDTDTTETTDGDTTTDDTTSDTSTTDTTTGTHMASDTIYQYDSNTKTFSEFTTNLYIKDPSTTADHEDMSEWTATLYYDATGTSNLDVYKHNGLGSIPSQYDVWTPSENLWIYESASNIYTENTDTLYTLREGSESNNMTSYTSQLYEKVTEATGGALSYDAIQLNLNQLALINESDITVSAT